MESLEISAKTAEEAVELALEQLGLGRKEVEVEVVKESKSGVFGLGAEEAIVRVTPLSLSGENVRVGVVEGILMKLLDLMGVDAEVEVLSSGEEGPVSLNVKGDDLGILIGRRGQTLLSLQHIVRLITSHCLKARVLLTIDVEGYRQRRYDTLRKLAARLGEQVRDTGRSFTLEPMPSYERRIIHITLADSDCVATESIGYGDDRKVVIQPRTNDS
jgi:spoIIIJ-associated protein